jgi:hypothetical protein
MDAGATKSVRRAGGPAPKNQIAPPVKEPVIPDGVPSVTPTFGGLLKLWASFTGNEWAAA